ncbi:MAG: protein-glutamate O-methyltransferase CheR [Oligoflexia bacterium]|nr:protein-glutamate O-methyltransferase CheR [Oligoflexia bacterium]
MSDGYEKVDVSVYEFFADYILKNTGIVYAKNEYYRLEKRLRDLVSELDAENVAEVYQRYRTRVSKEMHDKLLEVATNNETYFFRDDAHFRVLNKVIIPAINKEVLSSPSLGHTKRRVTVWSAGCSSGQEPCSILIHALEEYPLLDISIDATDISMEVLDVAKEAVYDELDVQRGMPIKMLIKYFEQLPDDRWRLRTQYRQYLSFGRLNLLLDDFPSRAYDVIFCRNVLIYQTLENKKKIIEKFHRSLKSDGHFMMGSGEALPELSGSFVKVFAEGGVVYKKS